MAMQAQETADSILRQLEDGELSILRLTVIPLLDIWKVSPYASSSTNGSCQSHKHALFCCMKGSKKAGIFLLAGMCLRPLLPDAHSQHPPPDCSGA